MHQLFVEVSSLICPNLEASNLTFFVKIRRSQMQVQKRKQVNKRKHKHLSVIQIKRIHLIVYIKHVPTCIFMPQLRY